MSLVRNCCGNLITTVVAGSPIAKNKLWRPRGDAFAAVKGGCCVNGGMWSSLSANNFFFKERGHFSFDGGCVIVLQGDEALGLCDTLSR